MLVRNPCVRDARVLREAGALSAVGQDVTIVAVLEPGLPTLEERDGFRIRRIDPVPAWLRAVSQALRGRPAGAEAGPAATGEMTRRPWLRTLLFDRTVSAAFARAARATPADVYHAHDLNMLGPAIIAARSRGAFVVYDAHELYPEMNGLSPRERSRWARTERRLIGHAGRVITVNESLAAELVKRYRIARPTVVMNIPDIARERGTVRLDVLKGPGTKILYIGWITAGRGIEQAMEALSEVEDASLVLLGPERGEHGAHLRAHAVQLGVENRVAFAGAVPPEDVVAIARDATLGLCTIRNVGLSYYLSLPNKLFEYLHAGLPVVVSDFPELRRIVKTYDAGLTCDPDDPRSIAAAIVSVTRQAAVYERLRAGARHAARAFTWEQEAKKLTELYAQLSHP